MKKILLGILYWIVQLTWGGLLTIPGLLITGFAILFLGGTPHHNGFSYIVEVGGNWGGIDIGCVSMCGRYNTQEASCYNPNYYEHVRRHEFGHSIQQLILGPFQLFVVGIPSVVRYWYFTLSDKVHKPYDYIWFEYTASKWGTAWINKLENADYPYNYER